MENLYNLLPTVLFFVSFYLIRVLVIIIHESGHAIPALLFSGKKVDIYIGTYTKTKKVFRIPLFHSSINFTRNFFWMKGCCYHEPTTKKWKEIIIILSGPILPVILSYILFKALGPSLHDGPQLFLLFLFAVWSVIDVFINLIPAEIPPGIGEGVIQFNDGMLIKNILANKSDYMIYGKMMSLVKEKKFEEAEKLLNESIVHESSKNSIDQWKIFIKTYLKKYDEALELIDSLKTKIIPGPEFYLNEGIVRSKLGDFPGAYKSYENALATGSYTAQIQNNIGMLQLHEKKYKEANESFQKALAIKFHPYYVNNLGYSKLLQGELEEGYSNIMKSLEADRNNAEAYRNLSFYYYLKSNYENAKENLDKAKSLDPETPFLAKGYEMLESIADKQNLPVVN